MDGPCTKHNGYCSVQGVNLMVLPTPCNRTSLSIEMYSFISSFRRGSRIFERGGSRRGYRIFHKHPPPLDIVRVMSSALRKIEKHPHSWTFTKGGGPTLGPMLKSLHRGPKGGGPDPLDPPPPLDPPLSF